MVCDAPNGKLCSCASVLATIDAYHVARWKSKRGDIYVHIIICAMDPKELKDHNLSMTERGKTKLHDSFEHKAVLYTLSNTITRCFRRSETSPCILTSA